MDFRYAKNINFCYYCSQFASSTSAGKVISTHTKVVAAKSVLFSFPFMTVIQEMCGRIGMVTGKGLSGVIKQHYSKKILYFAVTLLSIANTINIGQI